MKPGTNYIERSRQAAAAEARESLYRQAEQMMAERVAAAMAVARAKPCTCGHPWEEHEGDEGCLHGWGDLEEVEPCFCERR